MADGQPPEHPRGLHDAGVPLTITRGERDWPVHDGRATLAYRERLHELREDLEDALRTNDLGRTGRLRAEIEFLSGELASVVRGRHWKSTNERARLTVTKGIGSALARIRAAHAALGAHLGTTVRRGYSCAYLPDPGHPIVWDA